MTEEKEACANCRFFEYESSDWAKCLRHAPVVQVGHGVDPYWPFVHDYHWCGDHEKRQNNSLT